MQLDPTSLTVAGLVLTLITIIATLFAPFLVRGARVHYEVTGASELPRGGPIGNLRVQIFHAGNAINGFLYSIKATVRNSGRKDVVLDNFVDPISISLKGPYDLLYASAESDPGVGETVTVEGKSANLVWRILKPKEGIELNIIIRSDDPISRRSLYDITDANIRLKDVKSGKPFGHGLGLARFAAAFMIITTGFGGYFTYVAYSQKPSIVSDVNGETFRLRSTDFGYTICDVRNQRVYVSKCEKVNNNQVLDFVGQAEVRPVYLGFRGEWLLALLALSIAYSSIFSFLPLLLHRVLDLRVFESGLLKLGAQLR